MAFAAGAARDSCVACDIAEDEDTAVRQIRCAADGGSKRNRRAPSERAENIQLSKISNSQRRSQAAGLGIRLRELRWKNKAWLTTAETMAGWNGFEIRNAGSGRSPVRNRSG
jgi:hypothetical protein